MKNLKSLTIGTAIMLVLVMQFGALLAIPQNNKNLLAAQNCTLNAFFGTITINGTATDGVSVALTDLTTGAPALTATTAGGGLYLIETANLATCASAGDQIQIVATLGADSATTTVTYTPQALTQVDLNITTGEIIPVLTSISVTPATPTINIESTQQFTATALDQNNSPLVPQPAFTWLSSDQVVATIDATGLASGLTAGTTIITASSGAVSGTSNLTVIDPATIPVLTSIIITPSTSTVNAGGTYQFSATALDQFNNPINAVITWGSSNQATGTINASGLFSALAEGTSIITASSGAISSTATVTVPALSTILSVTQVSAIKTFATADNTFANGWKWIFNVTAPSNETNLAMKFSDWTSGANAISAGNNIRFYSAESSNANSEATAIPITAANAYSANMILNGDMDAVAPGRQIQIVVEVKVPVGTPLGSYSAGYGIQTL